MTSGKKLGYISFLGIVLVASTLAGVAVFTSLSSLYANKELRSMSKQMTNVIRAQPVGRYAKVKVVSSKDRTITVEQKNFFNMGDVGLLTVLISDQTVIAHQELLGTAGVYDSLSPLTPANLTDIHPGDKVLIFTGAQGKLTADLVLFGNPL